MVHIPPAFRLSPPPPQDISHLMHDQFFLVVMIPFSPLRDLKRKKNNAKMKIMMLMRGSLSSSPRPSPPSLYDGPSSTSSPSLQSDQCVIHVSLKTLKRSHCQRKTSAERVHRDFVRDRRMIVRQWECHLPKLRWIFVTDGSHLVSLFSIQFSKWKKTVHSHRFDKK